MEERAKEQHRKEKSQTRKTAKVQPVSKTIQAPEQEAGGWKRLGRIFVFCLWENIHLWLYIYVCLLAGSVTFTQSPTDLISLYGIAQCLIFTQGHWLLTWSTATVVTCAVTLATKRQQHCCPRTSVLAYVSMLTNAWARDPALPQTSTSPLLSFRWNAPFQMHWLKCKKHNSQRNRNIRSLGQNALSPSVET